MIRFGMPTLIELDTLDQSAALCRELGLSFVEMNMNLPQFQTQAMDAEHLKRVAQTYGIGFTVHLDENMNPADFNPVIAQAYRQAALDGIEFAKRAEIPVLNMHMVQGVYFTLPEGKVYLFEKFCREYRDNMLRFRDACHRAVGDSGVKVCIENWHGYTPVQIQVLDELLESDAFGLTYDVGHNLCKNGMDEPVILARKNHLHHMHLHDVKDGTKDHQPLGTGELDTFKYLELARERGTSVVVETKTVAGLRQSAVWMQEKDLL